MRVAHHAGLRRRESQGEPASQHVSLAGRVEAVASGSGGGAAAWGGVVDGCRMYSAAYLLGESRSRAVVGAELGLGGGLEVCCMAPRKPCPHRTRQPRGCSVCCTQNTATGPVPSASWALPLVTSTEGCLLRTRQPLIRLRQYQAVQIVRIDNSSGDLWRHRGCVLGGQATFARRPCLCPVPRLRHVPQVRTQSFVSWHAGTFGLLMAYAVYGQPREVSRHTLLSVAMNQVAWRRRAERQQERAWSHSDLRYSAGGECSCTLP